MSLWESRENLERMEEMKNFVLAAFLVMAIGHTSFSYGQVWTTPAVNDRVVYSTSITFNDGRRVQKGDAVPNIPIRLHMRVERFLDAVGDGGPRQQLIKEWYYYTFTDSNGGFDIPSLRGSYVYIPRPGSQLRVVKPTFAILERTGNVEIEEGNDTIRPFYILHPSDPLKKILAELIEMKAQPIHSEDEARLMELIGQMSEL